MDINWIQEGTLYYHIPKDFEPRANVAAFDIDWTLAYSQKHVFGTEPDDIYIFPRCGERLKELYQMGVYTIALFTNQYAVSQKEIQKRLGRMATFLGKIGVPCCLFIATGKDKAGYVDNYRKPRRGMWDKLLTFLPEVETAFFVGDAMGRPQDYSDSDLKFAELCEIKAKTPEQYFGKDKWVFKPSGKDMVVLVGMPGCGKTTLYETIFAPLDFKSVSQDGLSGGKTRKRLLAKLDGLLRYGSSVVIDNTSPSQVHRQEYYDIAAAIGYTVTVIFMIRDGKGWNELRSDEKRVPFGAYTSYFSKFDAPTVKNTPGKLILVT